jgi:hypothetical protein
MIKDAIHPSLLAGLVCQGFKRDKGGFASEVGLVLNNMKQDTMSSNYGCKAVLTGKTRFDKSPAKRGCGYSH